MIDKQVAGLEEAVAGVFDGATVMIGGFGEAGSPIELIHALIDQGATDLTVVNNNTGSGEVGLAALIKASRVAKMICSYPRTQNSTVFPELYASGRTKLELVPQGTLAERIRAGGAGIPAFYTATSVHTPLAEGKEQRTFGERDYVLEHGLRGDFAFIKAKRADRYGNLVFNKTARNFAPVMATACEGHRRAGRRDRARRRHRSGGGRDAGRVRQPHCSRREPGLRVGARRQGSQLPMSTESARVGLTRDEMAQRVAVDIPNGTYVNLGIGMPELIAKYVPEGRELIYHTENGLLGMGPSPEPGAGDPELINAGKRQVTAIPGACYFHHADSFVMIRGGHIDLCVLGALQVAQNGDLANWSTGGKGAIPAVGGAMDLVAGVRQIWVVTQHCTKHGEPKIVEACTYPLTGKGVVTRIYTELCILDVTPDGLRVVELSPDVSFDYVQQRTGAKLLHIANNES